MLRPVEVELTAFFHAQKQTRGRCFYFVIVWPFSHKLVPPPKSLFLSSRSFHAPSSSCVGYTEMHQGCLCFNGPAFYEWVLKIDRAAMSLFSVLTAGVEGESSGASGGRREGDERYASERFPHVPKLCLSQSK